MRGRRRGRGSLRSDPRSDRPGGRERRLNAYQLAPRAERDLEAIADFYAVERRNPAAARKVVAALRQTCRRASEAPALGRARPDLGPEVRSKVAFAYPYLIYYRPAPAGISARIQVIRILHQARDVEAAFAEDEPS